jgi:hypothetical protein
MAESTRSLLDGIQCGNALEVSLQMHVTTAGGRMAEQQAVNAVRYSSELAFDSSVTINNLKLTDSMSTRSNLFT